MNSKVKGARAERRARRMLEAEGWTVVRAGREPSGHSSWAFSRAGRRLVQVKCNRKPRRAEREALATFNTLPTGARKKL